MAVARGDGVGIEVADSVVRGVRLRHDTPGRVAATAELPFVSYDDGAALDSFVLLRAELGDPVEPTRLATFPTSGIVQRVDVTGRPGPELNELRSALNRRFGIDSTMLVDDGPRRWMLTIRWHAHTVRRLEDLAERAGFVDVTVEPSPLALARVLASGTTYARRLVAQSDAHHSVLSNGVPVAASGLGVFGRAHPRVEAGPIEVPMAWFDDQLDDSALTDALLRADRVATTFAAAHEGAAASFDQPVQLVVAGAPYPVFPDNDVRSADRQAVALGAAVGAAGLAGSLHPVDMTSSTLGDAQRFDRAWAIERMSDLPDVRPAPPGRIKRMKGRLLPRRSPR